MCSNCALRSGCDVPSRVLRLPAGCIPPRAGGAASGPRPHRMISPRQFFGQPPGALASPAERRLGVATYPRLQQRLRRRQQPRVGFLQRWATAPRSSHPGRLRDALWRWFVEFPQASGDRGAGQTGRRGLPAKYHPSPSCALQSQPTAFASARPFQEPAVDTCAESVR